jgi:hypothetical protein
MKPLSIFKLYLSLIAIAMGAAMAELIKNDG